MPRKTLFKIVGFGVAALGIFFVYHMAKQLTGEHGVTDNVSNLQKVYQKGGAQVAATFTNSLIQEFPFDGPISWRLQYLKAPCVILTGKVNTNALHQFISDHPAIEFTWWGTNANGSEPFETGWPDAKDYPTTSWKSILFQTDSAAGRNQAAIKGRVDFPASNVMIQSWGSD